MEFTPITLYFYQHGAQTGSVGGAMSGDWCKTRYNELLTNGEGWRIVRETDAFILLQQGRKQRFVRFERT